MPDDKYTKIHIVQGVDKRTEFTTGEYCAQKGGNWDADAAPEILLSHDSARYKAVRALAHRLKGEYPLDSLDPIRDRDEIVRRERAIVKGVVDGIHEQYGKYNPHIAAGASSRTHSSLHGDSDRSDTANPAALHEFGKDELVCRHFAPLAAALCTEAGMKTLTVGGEVNHFDLEMGSPSHITESGGQMVAGHMFVISRVTGNVIEPTGDGKYAYKQAINGLSVDEVIAGKTIITADSGRMSAYGTGAVGSREQEVLIAQRLEKIQRAEFDTLPYQATTAHTQAMFDINRMIAKDDIKKYDTRIVTEHFHSTVKPSMKQLDEAVARGDVDAVKHIDATIPIAPRRFAQILKQKIKTQQHPEMAGYAIDRGALSAFESSLKPEDLPFWVNLTDQNVTFNPQMARTIIQKSGTPPAEYLRTALKTGWTQHVETGLEMMEPHPIDPEIKALLEKRSRDYAGTRENGHAKRIDTFLRSRSGDVAQISSGGRPAATPKKTTPDDPTLDPQPQRLERRGANDSGFTIGGMNIGTGSLLGAGLLAVGGALLGAGGGWLMAVISAAVLGAAGWFAGDYVQKTMFNKPQGANATTTTGADTVMVSGKARSATEHMAVANAQDSKRRNPVAAALNNSDFTIGDEKHRLVVAEHKGEGGTILPAATPIAKEPVYKSGIDKDYTV